MMRCLTNTLGSMGRAGALAALTLSLWATACQSAPRDGFKEFAGSWSGSGRVESAGGSEAIRCRAQYRVDAGGSGIEQRLVCASASYRFDINCQVSNDGGRVTGTWSETTRGVTGSLSGTLGDGRLQAVVKGPLFGASLSLVTRGNAQEVVISPQDNDVRQVSIRLRRG